MYKEEQIQIVETMHGTTLITCDLCGKPPLLPFRRLIAVKSGNVEAWTHGVLSLPSLEMICTKCCQNLLLVGSLLLQWEGKVRVKFSFCASASERRDLTEDFVNNDNDSNDHDETDNGNKVTVDEAIEDADEDAVDDIVKDTLKDTVKDSQDVKPFLNQVSPKTSKGLHFSSQSPGTKPSAEKLSIV